MFNVTTLIHTYQREPILAALREAVRDVPDALVEPTLPGVRNGGDILMHLQFADDDKWSGVQARVEAVLSTPAVSHVDSAATAVTHWSRQASWVRVSRTVPAGGSRHRRRRRRTLRGRPCRHASLCPQHHRVAAQPRRDRHRHLCMTHVFSQRFTDLEGLTGPYLMHPIHWAYVDRWFDPDARTTCPRPGVPQLLRSRHVSDGLTAAQRSQTGGNDVGIGRHRRLQRRQHSRPSSVCTGSCSDQG